MEFIRANEINKFCGWVIDPSFLTRIQSHMIDSEEFPSLEEIETILLALEKELK